MSKFHHVCTLNAFDKIPVHEYKSKDTGLTVAIAEVDGPVINGYFCLVTEAFDDDGLPHTLEHLIFLGSEDYPYKGVLDLLANRCLASGTNAWTDIDHTCYTMETAGPEGFLTLMPIFLDHILYPVLSEEGFITEVHHITPEGDDAGVVYCEMQGRENSAESRVHLTMARKVYPGKCGYSSETGGIMKNLRESCCNEKVRNYHKEFYRPENLKIIITGRVKPDDVFKALEGLEKKILSRGPRGEFIRPWQSPIPPIIAAEDLTVRYPADEETNGLYGIAWRGPCAVTELYLVNALTVLMKYLTMFSVSPLQKEFVEIDDPYASEISSHTNENMESCVYFWFENVPKEKLGLINDKLLEVLKRIVDEEDVDMERMENIIKRHKLESLSSVENSPHSTIAFMIIGHMLYGNTKDDLHQRVNPLMNFDKMHAEPKSFWVELMRKYLVDNKRISLQGLPSIEERTQMACDEKARVDKQIEQLGVEGLKRKGEELQKAIDFNEIPAPEKMLTSVPIPHIGNIQFHEIKRFRSDSNERSMIDLSKAPVFTYFDHIKSNFVYMYTLMDTSDLSAEQRLYLPLLLEAIFESPINRNGKIIPFEEVVAELHNDMISSSGGLGLGGFDFKTGNFSHTALISLQTETAKYNKAIDWTRELLYETVLTAERLKVIATKMINNVARAKRDGRNIASYVMKELRYTENSNIRANGILKQHTFLTQLVEKLNSDNASVVIDMLNEVRQVITKPANITLYCAGNLNTIKDASEQLKKVLPERLKECAKQECLNVTADYALQIPVEGETKASCILGLGCLESSYFYQSTPSINNYGDADVPALLLYLQYLIQAEGPMWKQIRGKGLSYGYSIILASNEALLYLVFSRSTNIVAAYKEAYDIVTKQLKEQNWDCTLLESAKSSLIFELIDEEKTIGNIASLSLHSYFQAVDYTHNRELIDLIGKVTVDDLNRIGDKYIAALFEPAKVKTAIVCNPSKAQEIKNGFEKMQHNLIVYPSLEESFLKV